ncbi:MAG: glycosyltransferase [Aquabacterium sp.]|nr:glycosyltransferase [Aquabacterium sp.]
MKFTIIIDRVGTDTGGTEGQIIKLIHGLGASHNVELIVFQPTPWLEAAGATLPCRVTSIPLGGITKPRFYLGLFKLWRHLRQQRPDTVHTFFPVANVVGVLMARLAGVRQVLSSRRDYGYWITPGYLKATRFANRFVDGIVTNAPQVRKFTIETEGVPPERVMVIYNGVDIDALQRPHPDWALKAQLGIPAHHKVIALVANYRPIKRHDTLIKAAHILMQHHPNISLLCVGVNNSPDSYWQDMLTLARECGLADRIHCSEAVGNIADYLSIIDIGVNCSDSEGLSNAVIEYMAAHIPSIVSDGGGNPDLVTNGINGLIYPVGDAQILAQHLRYLLDNPEIAKTYAETAFQRVHAEMRLEAMLTRFESTYSAKNTR